MSRIGRKPIVIPAGVTVTVDEAAHTVAVKGPKGSLNSNYHPLMTVKVEGNEVLVTRPNDENLIWRSWASACAARSRAPTWS